LKKAAELSILCGLRINLVFSDIQSHVYHVFANDSPFTVDYKELFRDAKRREGGTVYEYAVNDYPFEKSLEGIMKTEVEDREIKRMDEEKRKAEIEEMKQLLTPDDIPISKIEPLGSSRVQDQLASINTDWFTQDIDTSLKNIWETGGDDESSIVLLSAKQLVESFKLPEDHSGNLLSTCLTPNTVNGLMLSSRSKQHTSPLIVQKLKSLTDTMADALIHPKLPSTAPTGLARPPKAISSLLVFLVKSFIQQIRLLDGLYSNDARMNDIRSLVSSSNCKYVEQMIGSILNIIALNRFKAGQQPIPMLAIPRPLKSSFGAGAEKLSDRDRKMTLTQPLITAFLLLMKETDILPSILVRGQKR